MIRFFLLFLLTTTLFSSQVERFRWVKGETYLIFLEKQKLPLKKLYYDLDKDDQRLTEEMRTGVHCQILKDDDGIIEQVLLPLMMSFKFIYTKIKMHIVLKLSL